MPRMRFTSRAFTILAGLGLWGCTPAAGPSANESVDDLTSVNGLPMINGLTMPNGLSSTGISGNGLSGKGLLMSPLSTTGLVTSSPVMNSSTGRTTVSYLVRCALPLGRILIKNDSSGNPYIFPGQIGVAPEWETGTCNTACQERVTACMLAHVNTSGKHIAIWLDSEGVIGYGQNTSFPYQEGSFFGNIFDNPPVANFCNGKDFDLGTVPGRLGVSQPGAPYKNPFPGMGLCARNCVPAPSPHGGDGFKQCLSYTHVVTVWRNFDPSTPYKICNKQSGSCLSVSSGSTANNAPIVEAPYAAAASQKWMITQISPQKYKVINLNSAKALDKASRQLSKGQNIGSTDAVQETYKGAPDQLWSFPAPTVDRPGSYQISPSQEWTVVPG